MHEIISLNFERETDGRLTAAMIGQTGEDLAAAFLIRRGHRMVCSNFKVPIGRNLRGAAVTGEIDLITLEQNILCFTEVKTRSSDEFAAPLAAIDLRKQRQITRTAKIYRKIFDLQNIAFRYDAISVVLPSKGKPMIEHFPNFWTENKFRKKFWNDIF